MNPPAELEYQLPLFPDVWAYLRIPRKLTPDEWDRLTHLLDVMKAGLVADPVMLICKALGHARWAR